MRHEYEKEDYSGKGHFE